MTILIVLNDDKNNPWCSSHRYLSNNANHLKQMSYDVVWENQKMMCMVPHGNTGSAICTVLCSLGDVKAMMWNVDWAMMWQKVGKMTWKTANVVECHGRLLTRQLYHYTIRPANLPLYHLRFNQWINPRSSE